MAFDWMQVKRPPARGDGFREQIRRAARERARLFFDLGYTADQATARIRAAIDWELDASAWPSSPGFSEDVAKLVGEVYARGQGR